ncbi:hypothetical protein [Pseudooceanicola nanhaiensis]|uniref:hypothetical protein n=1 Tax=Pseudooceanicola nanhaiensis TaxID=375761 RepID=UPI001CD49EBE|nr:hypothetical protein [Pseudooceanicola nanhaiensis]MCA0920945.1 hypothetical protein [Pseudooceanicola nanhaiensis]
MSESPPLAHAAPVYLHAGAHRTGTSSFQMCLSLNADALRAAGYDLAYPGRDGIPGGNLQLRLPAPRHGPRKVRRLGEAAGAHLAALRSDATRPLILSEENIPGRMLHFYQGRFYPAAAARARALKTALPGPVAHLLYVVRPYDTLYVSAYRKRAEDRPVEPFATIRPRLMAMDRGWLELMELLIEQLTPARVTVVDYAARGSSAALLGHLLEADPAGLKEPGQVVNLSATDAALEALQARYARGETLERDAWKAVIAEHAEAQEPRGFAAFTQGEAEDLRARYAADMERLGRMPGVSVVQ